MSGQMSFFVKTVPHFPLEEKAIESPRERNVSQIPYFHVHPRISDFPISRRKAPKLAPVVVTENRMGQTRSAFIICGLLLILHQQAVAGETCLETITRSEGGECLDIGDCAADDITVRVMTFGFQRRDGVGTTLVTLRFAR